MITVLTRPACLKGELSLKESLGRRSDRQLERIEKAQQEPQGKTDRMMDTMARTTKGEEVAENHVSQEGHACQNSKENPLHSPRFTHHHAQTSQKSYMPKMP